MDLCICSSIITTLFLFSKQLTYTPTTVDMYKFSSTSIIAAIKRQNASGNCDTVNRAIRELKFRDYISSDFRANAVLERKAGVSGR